MGESLSEMWPIGKAPAEKFVTVHKNSKLSIPPYTMYGGIKSRVACRTTHW